MSNNTCAICDQLQRALDSAPDDERRRYWRKMLTKHVTEFDHAKYFEALRSEPIRVDSVWPSVNKRGG